MTEKYGYAHRQTRKRWRALIDAGEVWCCLCGKWLAPGSAFDLDHAPGTDQYRGAACPSCNRSEGASRGNRMRGRSAPKEPSRWVL